MVGDSLSTYGGLLIVGGAVWINTMQAFSSEVEFEIGRTKTWTHPSQQLMSATKSLCAFIDLCVLGKTGSGNKRSARKCEFVSVQVKHTDSSGL